MSKGIIYVMTTAVPGLIKIGRTDNFDNRMRELECNGYRNVTALKRHFAIEVEGYIEKEKLLHTIFEKSRLADSELFAVDINTAVQLLASFDGKKIYPKDESKEEIFEEAFENSEMRNIPDGIYTFERKKKSEDNRLIKASVSIIKGNWTLLKGSIISVIESKGVSRKSLSTRAQLIVDDRGILKEDFELGRISPSFASAVVYNGADDGWLSWKNKGGIPLGAYREKEIEE